MGYFATVFNNLTLSTDGCKIVQGIDLASMVLWVARMAEGDDDAIELVFHVYTIVPWFRSF